MWQIQIVEEFDSHMPGSGGRLFNKLLWDFDDPAATTVLYNAVSERILEFAPRWSAFLHLDIRGTEREFIQKVWPYQKQNIERIFTFGQHLSDYVHEKTGLPVTTCALPIRLNFPLWDLTKFEGNFVTCGAHFRDTELVAREMDGAVLVSLGQPRAHRIPPDAYNYLLERCVVVENFTSCVGSTTITECISRGTPIITNRLPAIEEYLGKDYPLFYQDSPRRLAQYCLQDRSLLQEASTHLLGRRPFVSAERFTQTMKAVSDETGRSLLLRREV